MKISISYISIKHYGISNIHKWVWMLKPYKHFKGVIIRIFGIYINIRENNATQKLIAKHNVHLKRKQDKQNPRKYETKQI